MSIFIAIIALLQVGLIGSQGDLFGHASESKQPSGDWLTHLSHGSESYQVKEFDGE